LIIFGFSAVDAASAVGAVFCDKPYSDS